MPPPVPSRPTAPAAPALPPPYPGYGKLAFAIPPSPPAPWDGKWFNPPKPWMGFKHPPPPTAPPGTPTGKQSYLAAAAKLQLDTVLQAMDEGKDVEAALDVAVRAEAKYAPPADRYRNLGATGWHKVVPRSARHAHFPPPPYWRGEKTGGRPEAEEGMDPMVGPLTAAVEEEVGALANQFNESGVAVHKHELLGKLSNPKVHKEVYEQKQEPKSSVKPTERERYDWVDPNSVEGAPVTEELYMNEATMDEVVHKK